MRGKLVLAVGVLAIVAAAGLGEGPKASKAGGNAPIFTPAADLKWMDLDPSGAPGVKIADVWGDHTKGGFGAFIKFPAGFMAPLHRHTNSMKIVIVSGTFIAGPEGKPEVRMGAGSYFLQPGGGYRHTTACDKDSECIFFAESTGKFDLKPVEAPAKK